MVSDTQTVFQAEGRVAQPTIRNASRRQTAALEPLHSPRTERPHAPSQVECGGKANCVKAFWRHLVHDWKFVVLPALAKLGIWGAFVVAVLDASSIPVPIDAVLAVYIWNHKSHFWIYVLVAAAGSAVGGLLPYWIGRAGGEIFLLKRINRERFDALCHRFERQEFLAVMIPSLLPPPAPWKIFVFTAGVFEMRVPSYMLAVFCGRVIRWTALSILVIKLGPGAVDLVAHHALALVIAVGGLAVVGGFWWWWSRKRAGKPLF